MEHKKTKQYFKMKSEGRVHKAFKKGTADWNNQYNMLLDDGITCGQCVHSLKCKEMFGGDDNNKTCQFFPNKFIAK